MRVLLADSVAELERVVPVLLELRPAYDTASLLRQIEAQREFGYRIAYVEANGKVVCVAGFVVAMKLAWGRHVYVDDLVTAAHHRSSGAGALLIDWLKAWALEQGCAQLHLDSGVQRFGAHRFYLREGFDITSHHFAMELSPASGP